MSDGFWLRMFIGDDKSPKEETYEFFKYSDGYTEEDKKDDEQLREHTLNWAENDMCCWGRERFRYGFEVVIVPPSCWLQEELIRLGEAKTALTQQENLINNVLGIS